MKLTGKRVAFAGELLYITRTDATQFAEGAGAIVTSGPADADVVVVGLAGWHLEPGQNVQDFSEPTRQNIGVISEKEFLETVGAQSILAQFRAQYTPDQLSRITGAASNEVRRWVRHGVLRPIRIVNRLPWFDFAGLSHARKLKQLTDSGIQLRAIKSAVAALTETAQDAGLALSRLEPLYARPVFRLSDGSASEPTGQLLLNFGAGNDAPRILDFQADDPRTAEDWFNTGVTAEDEDDLPRAEESYLASLREGGPDAETSFNLGNVLYRLDRIAEASRRFLEAVEMDDTYVEAWNNLGNALASLERWEEAAMAYRRAIDIEPHYADAHFNLAETLDEAGLEEEARLHWFAYLREDSESEVAKTIRARLLSEVPQDI